MISQGEMPGEWTVRAVVTRNLAEKRILQVDVEELGAISVHLESKEGDWLEGRAMQTVTGAGGTRVVEPGQPLELLRVRALEEVVEEEDHGPVTIRRTDLAAPTGPADGFVVWIEEAHAGSRGKPLATGPHRYHVAPP
ncbi:MAG: hypothetical protein NTW96_05435 [Planctomycetia bacterium]|nr:hypothetical protein [Planctomycetia bacterium]